MTSSYIFRWKQGIHFVFQRKQKIRTLLLSEKSSDFVDVVHLQGLEPWAHWLREQAAGSSRFMEVSSHRYFWAKQRSFSPGNFCTLCRILQRKAPSARFETVQSPCRNRALILWQTKSLYPLPTWRHWFEWPQIRASNIEILPFPLKTFSTASLKHTDGFPRGGERGPHCTRSSSKKDARFITITNYYLYETTPAVRFGKVVSNL